MARSPAAARRANPSGQFNSVLIERGANETGDGIGRPVAGMVPGTVTGCRAMNGWFYSTDAQVQRTDAARQLAGNRVLAAARACSELNAYGSVCTVGEPDGSAWAVETGAGAEADSGGGEGPSVEISSRSESTTDMGIPSSSAIARALIPCAFRRLTCAASENAMVSSSGGGGGAWLTVG